MTATLTAAESRRASPRSCYKLAGPEGRFALDATFEGVRLDERRMAAWIPYADGNRRDGVGDLLEVGGIDFSRHVLNPVHLFDHGKKIELPIGLVQDPQSGEYTGSVDPVAKTATDLVFFYQGDKQVGADRHRANDHAVFCEQVYDLLSKKMIRAGSIGYQVKRSAQLAPDYERGTPAGLHLLSVLKLESSTVVMPANPDTVGKLLSLPRICGRRISPYLVKSLAEYAPPRKAQLGYEKRLGKALDKPMGFASHVHTPDQQELADTYGGDVVQVGDKLTARTYLMERVGPGKFAHIAKTGERVTVTGVHTSGQITVRGPRGVEGKIHASDTRWTGKQRARRSPVPARGIPEPVPSPPLRGVAAREARLRENAAQQGQSLAAQQGQSLAGQPCQQGQTAAGTGCVPATKDLRSKYMTTPKPVPGKVAKKSTPPGLPHQETTLEPSGYTVTTYQSKDGYWYWQCPEQDEYEHGHFETRDAALADARRVYGKKKGEKGLPRTVAEKRARWAVKALGEAGVKGVSAPVYNPLSSDISIAWGGREPGADPGEYAAGVEAVGRKYLAHTVLAQSLHWGVKDLSATTEKAQPSASISSEKARQILKDGEANGHPLTPAQRGMFWSAASREEKVKYLGICEGSPVYLEVANA